MLMRHAYNIIIVIFYNLRYTWNIRAYKFNLNEIYNTLNIFLL
jgi:hypothetical protein